MIFLCCGSDDSFSYVSFTGPWAQGMAFWGVSGIIGVCPSFLPNTNVGRIRYSQWRERGITGVAGRI